MASKKKGRRERPWWKKEGKVIRYVPGYWIRHINPNFDIAEEHSPTPKPGMPYVPENEIWIDERFEGEKHFLLKMLWHERRCPETGEVAMRKWLNERIVAKNGRFPTKADLKAITRKTQRKGGLLIRYVRGELVRKWWDAWFVFGGHAFVYPHYIPENEVWIDIRQDSREVPFTLHHELHERKNMKKGMRYPRAHRLATASEQKLRSRELPIKRKKNRLRPLQVDSFSQVDGIGCGTTSLKCVSWFHGRKFSRKELDRLCGLTEDGIDHEPLAVGATKTGAYAFMKDEGTLSELRFFLAQGLPVIVGWWSVQPDELEQGYSPVFDPSWDRDTREEMDAGHYSVVFHMSDKYIWLMDPQRFEVDGEIVRGGERRMRIEDFLKVWNDTDTDEYKHVQRWYLVVNYDDRTFADRLKGGKDYQPQAA